MAERGIIMMNLNGKKGKTAKIVIAVVVIVIVLAMIIGTIVAGIASAPTAG